MDFTSIPNLIKDIESKKLTCVQIMQEAIKRAEEKKEYNIFTFLESSNVLIQKAKLADERYAKGTARPFEGIPIAIKANIDTSFQPTCGATKALQGRYPKQNSDVVDVIVEKGGCISIGKTNMHELAFGITTNNATTGTTHNGTKFGYCCGGSSGGSGAVTGAQIVPLALGTDTGGSVRIPSACNGVYGFRPTIHFYPYKYGIKMTHLRDSVGPLATSLENIMELNKLFHGNELFYRELTPKKITLGTPKYFFVHLDEEIQKAYEQALSKVKAAGVEIVEKDIENLADLLAQCSGNTINQEIWPRLTDYLIQNEFTDLTAEKVVEQIMSVDVKGFYDGYAKSPLTDEEYNKLLSIRGNIVENVQMYFQENNVDALFYPSLIVPVPKSGTNFFTFKGEDVPLMKSIKNLDVVSNTNSPGLVLPFAKDSNGLPICMELMCPTGHDINLMEIGKCIDGIINK